MLLEAQLKALALLNMFVIYCTLCWLHSWSQSFGSQATSQSFKVIMNSQGGHMARTFALICVFVKNCLCGYNFPIPMEKTKIRGTSYYILVKYIVIFSCIYNTYPRKRSRALEKCSSDNPGEIPYATSSNTFRVLLKSICHNPSISGPCTASINANHSKDFRTLTLEKRLLWLN